MVLRWLLLLPLWAEAGPGLRFEPEGLAAAGEPSGVESDTERALEDAATIKMLRSELEDERRRALIADVASMTAIKNATEQAKMRAAAEQKLREYAPKLKAAQESAAKAEAEVGVLHANLTRAETRRKAAEEKERDVEARLTAIGGGAGRTPPASVSTTVAALVTHPVERKPAKVVMVNPTHTPLGAAMWNASMFIRTCPYQKLLALVAGSSGLLSVWDPIGFSKVCAVSAASMLVGMASIEEARCAWNNQLSSGEGWVIAFVAAAITAIGAVMGFKGFNLWTGAALALLGAHLVSQWAMVYAWTPPWAVIWYVLCTGLGVVVMLVGEENATAILGPCIGGLLVSSATLFLASSMADRRHTPTWIEFVDTLISGKGADQMLGEQGVWIWRGAGFALWTTVCILGMTFHFYAWPSCLPCAPKWRPKPSQSWAPRGRRDYDAQETQEALRKPLVQGRQFEDPPPSRGPASSFEGGAPKGPPPPPPRGPQSRLKIPNMLRMKSDAR